jgi:DNA invertase Pin-like site-specific DNA recombinase
MSAKKPIPVAILVRVSTRTQETARQIRELKSVANSQDWKVVEVCEEQISGTAQADHLLASPSS